MHTIREVKVASLDQRVYNLTMLKRGGEILEEGPEILLCRGIKMHDTAILCRGN
jgi:hypothetical protein